MINKNSISRDFVAVDVEYADSSTKYICQVGLAVVRNLEIVDTKVWPIQPPGNYYSQQTMRHHRMSPDDTAGAPLFHQVWQEIYGYIKDMPLWAHNARSADQDAINKNIAYSNRTYGTRFDYITWVNDTMDLCPRDGGGNSLQLCCMAMGISFDDSRYHDAGYDAAKCAELVIAYANGVRPDWTDVPKDKEGIRKSQQRKEYLQLGQLYEYHERREAVKAKLKEKQKPKVDDTGQMDLFAEFSKDTTSDAPGEPLLTPEEDELLYHTDVIAVLSSTCDGAVPTMVDVFDEGDKSPTEGHDRVDYARLDTSDGNPLRGAKVAITGSFHVKRTDIKAALEEMGAKLTGSVAKTTSAFLIGQTNAGLPKLAPMDKLYHNGFIIPRIVGDDDLDRFLYGEARQFGVGENGVPRKDLNFTVAHFRKHRHELKYPENTIAGRELYFPPTGLMGRMDCFCQICGNLGAFGNWEYSPEVNLVVLPVSSVEGLQRGEKDDVIRGFEAYYNSQRSVVFDAEFVTERDILKFARERIVRCDDDVTADLYVKYLESAGIDPEKDFKYGLAVARKEYEKERTE